MPRLRRGPRADRALLGRDLAVAIDAAERGLAFREHLPHVFQVLPEWGEKRQLFLVSRSALQSLHPSELGHLIRRPTNRIAKGERIHTEFSHKYSLEGFRVLAATAGWRGVTAWTDPDGLFSLHLLRFG